MVETRREAAAILGVRSDSSHAEARRAYRARARLVHPDRFAMGSSADRKAAAEAMSQLNEAFRIFVSESDDNLQYSDHAAEDNQENVYEGSFGETYVDEDEDEVHGDFGAWGSEEETGSGYQSARGFADGRGEGLSQSDIDAQTAWIDKDRLLLLEELTSVQRVTLFATVALVTAIYVIQLTSTGNPLDSVGIKSTIYIAICFALLPLGVLSGVILVRQGIPHGLPTPWKRPFIAALLGVAGAAAGYWLLPTIAADFTWLLVRLNILEEAIAPNEWQAATGTVLLWAVIPSLLLMPVWTIASAIARRRRMRAEGRSL